MAIEREAKLAAAADVVLPNLQDVLPGIAVGPSSFRHLEAVYFDTPDLALARSGVTVRSRTGEPGPTWTVKLPNGGRASVLSRTEVTFEGSLGAVPLGALDLVLAFRRNQMLERVAVVRTTRAQFDLVGGRGPVATVCDDMVSAEAGAADPVVFREVEIEVVEGAADDDLLEVVVGRFLEAGCRAEKRTVAKVIRSLGERAQAAPDVVVPEVGKRSSVGDVVAAAFARSVLQVLHFDAGVRLGAEPEDLHQFRVATRRLRSDLRTFGPLLDATWAKRLSNELRWLDTAVGAVRDADVLLLRLVARLEALAPADVAAGRQLRRNLDQERVVGQTHLSKALSSRRYVALLDELVVAATAPSIAVEPEGLAHEGARPLLAGLAVKPWKRLRRAAEALTSESSDDELHRVRTLAKRCRYCAEAASPVFGAEAERLGSRLADVQTVLGDHHDTVVAEHWLRAAAKRSPSVRLVAGQLVAIERQERERQRERFPKAWKQAAKPSLRKWIG